MCAVQGQPTESVNMRSSNAKSTPAPLNRGGLTDGRKHICAVIFQFGHSGCLFMRDFLSLVYRNPEPQGRNEQNDRRSK